jgi:hypothetical protein
MNQITARRTAANIASNTQHTSFDVKRPSVNPEQIESQKKNKMQKQAADKVSLFERLS